MPVFMPFSGCPSRCVFCAQHAQSGTAPRSPQEALHALRDQLEERRKRGAPPVELGFFGGTFTALPRATRQACLDVVREERRRGTVLRARCSTRPDAVSADILAELKDAGFTAVELGVQSFNNAALLLSRRGYSGHAARHACALVSASGMALGVQLLPGMPGVSPAVFLEDVRAALLAGARTLRFYPCQVMADTELARLWSEGEYQPWSLKATLPALARGWLAAEAAGASVIRMGLAPEKDLTAHILAGPWHPALGSLVQGRALCLAVERAVRQSWPGAKLAALHAPRHCQGFFWGHRQSLRARWQALGLTPAAVRWHDAPHIRLARA